METPGRPRGTTGPLGLVVPRGAGGGVKSYSAGLDKQLRRAAILSLQSAMVCGKLRVYCRAGVVGAARSGVRNAVVAGPRGSRDRCAKAAVSRAGMGDLCARWNGRGGMLALAGILCRFGNA